ncbi:hypothetical protein MNBD_DELTA01-2124 [hydrothermal vent metagenome]|uniref:DUF559 domain-containing protein n=1 Tax=hydrothermal vent metagenome TaxID=652676 RepID=A0A3B0RG43_9ZZZZ
MAHFLQYTNDKNMSFKVKGHTTTMLLLRSKDKAADQALTTEAHLLLWRYLRLLELRGVTFIRHALIGGHYVDFLNMEKGLVMEVDAGRGRKTDKLEQERKDRWLAKQGFRVLRFTEEEITEDMPMVLDMMWESFIDDAHTPYLDELAIKPSTAINTSTVATGKINESSSNYGTVTPLKAACAASSSSGRHKPN